MTNGVERWGCPVFSVFDLAIEVEDLQIWRPLLQLGMGRVVDRFGIDWWDVISLMLQAGIAGRAARLRLAEKLKVWSHAGCKPAVGDGGSFATSVWEYRCK